MLAQARQQAQQLTEHLSAQQWPQDDYRHEMLLCAEGLWVMADLLDETCTPTADCSGWLARYRKAWLRKNKPSELCRITELFETLAAHKR